MAKKAALDGLDESQIRVFGLPIRPSFARAVLVKVYINVKEIISVIFLLLSLLVLTLSFTTGSIER